jgi:sugar transferase (PEP-CTERM/EpsH1 system associated)
LKILFLANRVPYPPYRGDKLKIYNLAKRLCGNNELHLLTFAQSEEDLTYRPELEKIFKKVEIIYLPKWKSILNCIPALWSDIPLQLAYFKSQELQQKLDSMVQEHKYDAVHVQHLRMSPYLAARKDVARILDLPDAFSLYWERRKNVKRSLAVTMFENMEQRRVLKYEKVLREYNMSLVCSAEDLTYLEDHHHSGNLRLLPNGVDLQTFVPGNHDYTQNKTLLFTGNMDYEPNIDAVVYFTHSILPLIREKHPDVKLVIAGQRPVPKVLELAGPSVEVTGFVKNLADTYNTASVVVAPLRFGAGTQNKVLEAMAMGIPVVCSNIGFAGLGISSGEGAIMQTDPNAFAATVTELLSSEDMRRETGQAGAEIIRTRFDWDIIAKTLEQYLQQVAAAK